MLKMTTHQLPVLFVWDERTLKSCIHTVMSQLG